MRRSKVKKLIKFFLICLVMLGLVIGISASKNVEADICDLPPEGQPLPQCLTTLP